MAFTEQEVPTHYAKKLAKNFRDQKLGKKLKGDDTQGVWFSGKMILEALGLPNDLIGKCKDPETGEEINISGIRFYLGAYEENHPRHPKNKGNKGKVTIIMVQTTKKSPHGKLIDQDILKNPNDPPCYELKGEGLVPVDKEYNDGQICPPYERDEARLLDFE